jgi:soluble lytic murein transglycosylase-like protein
MERTALEVLEDLRRPASSWAPYDPGQSVLLGVAYLGRACVAGFHERAADLEELWRFALAAYNAGPSRVSGAMREARLDEAGFRGMPDWIAAGRPPGAWQTWAGVREYVRRSLEADGVRNPAEPLEYVAAIELLRRRAAAGLDLAGRWA